MPSSVEWYRSHVFLCTGSPKPRAPASSVVAVHVGRRLPLLLRSAAPPAPSRSNLDRPDWIQRPQTADTPSGARFAKEPLADFIMEPTILYAFRFPRLLFWKAYFSFNRFKIKFHLITVLPLPLIAHNLFVLTPNWTIQLALDSSFRDLSVHIICHHVFEL